ncbi:MAG: hypothetical protein IT352_16330 [Gemmatimonadales bacterium]|nr:hypothetical protein [Gemmatimonadales bacterium]
MRLRWPDPPASANADGPTRWVLACLACAAAVIPLATRRQFLTGDPTYYIGLARSLAAGRGYTFNGETITVYPPGLSALLAPVVAWFDPDVFASQLAIAMFSPLALLAAVALAGRHDRRLRVPVAMAMAFSYPVFELATVGVRTDLPYLALSIGALAVVGGARPSATGGQALATGALVALAVLFRTAGIALAMAMVAALVHRRAAGRPIEGFDRGLMVGGIVGLATYLAWAAWATAQGGESYFQYLLLADPLQPDRGLADPLTLIARMETNLRIHLSSLAALATNLPWLAPTWSSPFVVGVGTILAVGTWVEWRKPDPTLAWYVVAYAALLLLWPFREGTRFLVPIFPVAILVGWQGAVALHRRLQAAPSRRAIWLGLAALAWAVLAGGEAVARPSRQLILFAAMWGAAATLALPAVRTGIGTVIRGRAAAVGALVLVVYVAIGVGRIGPKAATNVTGVGRSPNQGLEPAVKWLAVNADQAAPVMAEFASAVHFYTGLRAVSLPKTGDATRLVEAVRSARIRYLVILEPDRFGYWRPTEVERFQILDRAMPGRFRPIHRFPEGVIYRVD